MTRVLCMLTLSILVSQTLTTTGIGPSEHPSLCLCGKKWRRVAAQLSKAQFPGCMVGRAIWHISVGALQSESASLQVRASSCVQWVHIREDHLFLQSYTKYSWLCSFSQNTRFLTGNIHKIFIFTAKGWCKFRWVHAHKMLKTVLVH